MSFNWRQTWTSHQLKPPENCRWRQRKCMNVVCDLVSVKGKKTTRNSVVAPWMKNEPSINTVLHILVYRWAVGLTVSLKTRSTLILMWKSEFRPQFQFLSCTLGSGQTEGQGGGRHQDVSEDGPVSHRQRGGALLQQVQYSPSDVPGHITTDVQQDRHMLLTEGAEKQARPGYKKPMWSF